MSVYRKIQDCKANGKTKSETAKALQLSRTTVRKFWRMSESQYAGFAAAARVRAQRFDAYRVEIIELVESNEADGADVHASSVYDVLEERHGTLPGCERTLRNYVRMLRRSGAIAKRSEARVRRPQPESDFGKQCQVDFGQTRIVGGAVAYIFVAVLAASRARYVCVQDHPFRGAEVITHLLAGFRFFGGRPRQLVIDQDRLMTVSENNGEIVHTELFSAFLDEQELSVWLCRKADPESKGKVENLVKFVKSSFFSARRFMSVEDIHEPLAQWLVRRANGRICQATGRIPQLVLEREERAALAPLRASVYDAVRRTSDDQRKADAKGMVSYLGNRYSVPDEYAECTVGVGSTAGQFIARDPQTGEEIARHRIPETKGQTVVAAHHRVPTGRKATEVYEELAARSSLAGWRSFVAANADAYPRYWKEQARSLTRFLDTAEQQELLEQALAFCIEADAVGAGDLQYAYEHLHSAYREAKEPLLTRLTPIVAARGKRSEPVAKRPVGYYSSIISLVVGRVA